MTLANVWMGSAGYRLARRFVVGPVGCGVATPWGVTPARGTAGLLFDVNRTITRFAGRWVNPLSRAASTHADLILAQNQETVSWLPTDARSRTVIFPHVALEAVRIVPRRRSQACAAGPEQDRARLVIMVGRLLPGKGSALAIRALSYLPGWRLTIIGDGPDRGRLERLTDERGLAERIEFAGWISKDVVHERLLEADVLLFPSLHDEGGWASAMAVAAGVPVVSLDRDGPGALGGRSVPPTTPGSTALALAEACVSALATPRVPDDRWSLARRCAALRSILTDRGIIADQRSAERSAR